MFIPSDNPYILLLEPDGHELVIKNITTMVMSIYEYKGYRINEHYISEHYLYRQLKAYRNMNMFDGKYKYLHKRALLAYINVKQPIFSLNHKMLKFVCKRLNFDDRFKLYIVGIC